LFCTRPSAAELAVKHLVEALAISRKIAGAIYDGFVGIFYWHNPYNRGVNSASDKNEYQEYFLWSKDGRCVGLTTLPPSCADCLEVWEPQTSANFRARLGL